MTPQQIIELLSLDEVDEPAHAVRTHLDPTEIQELADDIKRNGLISPIVVRPKNGRYEVVAGHRRLAACRVAGMTKIPAIVRELDEAGTVAIKISENLARQDMPPLDEGAFYLELINEHGMTLEDIMSATGRSENYIKGRIRLLGYPPVLRDAVHMGRIGLGAANWLGQITHQPELERLLNYAIAQGISEDEAERWYRNWLAFKDEPQGAGYERASDEELKEIARPKIQCVKCTDMADIRDLTLVYVHKMGCPKHLEEQR